MSRMKCLELGLEGRALRDERLDNFILLSFKSLLGTLELVLALLKFVLELND